MPQAATFQYASDSSLMIYFGGEIALDTHHRILKLLRLLERDPIHGVRNLHPAYCSLLVVFDALAQDHENLQRLLAEYLERSEATPLPEPRTVAIPVHYDGPDLQDVAALHNLSTGQVIELHSSATYVVYFLGFVPGFAYLGGLPSELATPRLQTPRKRVPAGSVAIGGNQTGVYPFSTPGGWRLIGRTPLEIFRADRPGMSLLSIGDIVRFQPCG